MTPEEIKKHAEDQKVETKKMQEAIEKAATKEAVEKIADNLKTLSEKEVVSKKDHATLVKAMEKQGEVLNRIEKEGVDRAEKTESFILAESIAKKAEQIKELKNGSIEIVSKTVGDITTGAQSLPSPLTPLTGTQIAPPGFVGLRGTFIDGVVNLFSTNQQVLTYTDTLPKEGDFDFLAEGEAATQLDMNLESRQATPVKMAAYERLTEEVLKDIPRIQSIATDYLRKKHDLKRQTGLLFDDGTSNTPLGVTEIASTFSAGTMANSIPNPNFMDVINACVVSIYSAHNYKDEVAFSPNVCLVNPVDFFIQFVAAKDGDGKPLYPTASLFNRISIGGLIVIPERSIPSGKIFVGDMSLYNVSRYVPYGVEIGYVNDDFIRGKLVIKGMSRFHAYVKNLHRKAFMYDDIATIKTALTPSL